MLRPDVIDNLRAVSMALGIQPKSFNMWAWRYESECGTTLCIAGHYGILRGLSANQIAINGIGCGLELTRILEKDFPEGDSVFDARLFHLCNWPHDLQMLYQTNPVAAGQAAIEWYIGLHAEKTQEVVECQMIAL